MRNIIKKLICLTVTLIFATQIAGCDGPAPRRTGGDNVFHSGLLVSRPWAAPGSYTILYVTSDMSLWEYDQWFYQEWMYNIPNRCGEECEEECRVHYSYKLLDNVVFVDWAMGGKVARTADNGLWLLDGDFDSWNDGYTVRIMDDVEKVAIGGVGVIVIKTDGTVWEWHDIYAGFNHRIYIEGYYDEAGDYFEGYYIVNTDEITPDDVPPPVYIMSDVVQIAAGGSHYMALKDDGSLWSWGREAEPWRSYSGITGDGTEDISSTPIKIMEGIAYIAASDEHSVALDYSGGLWVWGSNKHGQLGNGTKDIVLSPVKVMENVRTVETTSSCTFAAKKDGSIWAWGERIGSVEPVMVWDNDIEILSIRNAPHVVEHQAEEYYDEWPRLSGGFNILRADGSLWVISDEYVTVEPYIDGENIYGDPIWINQEWRFVLSPEKKMEDVSYADGGHAVKIDGSFWDVHKNIMILPPGSMYTGQ